MFRNFVFTLNNYTEEDEAIVQEFITTKSSYGIYGKEMGESKTPHLQGYVELQKRTRLKALKKQIGDRVHIEKRRGTAQQASDYCEKEDKEPFKYGTISKQGNRTDLKSFVRSIQEGKKDYELIESHPVAFLKYHKHAQRIRNVVARREHKAFKKLEVLVFWGAPGTGKTRKAYDIDPDLYNLPIGTGKTVWFDGYQEHKTILIDDFYGGAISYPYLLKLLDGYYFEVQVKGDMVPKCWERVILTSNKSPDEWYPTECDIAALKRRFTKVTHFDSFGAPPQAVLTPPPTPPSQTY